MEYSIITLDDISSINNLENSLTHRLISQEEIEKDFNNDFIYGIKAVVNNKLIAYGYIREIIDHSDLIAICVDKNYRNQKVATNILLKLEEHSFKNNISDIFLEVDIDNLPAIKFYESLGYIKINERKNYYPNGHTALIYTKKILGN